MSEYAAACRDLDGVREQGFRYLAVAHNTFDPDMDTVEYRVFVTAPGFRTWAFLSDDDCRDFKRRYAQAAPRG